MKWSEFKRAYLELCEDEGVSFSSEKETTLKQLWNKGKSLMDAFEIIEGY